MLHSSEEPLECSENPSKVSPSVVTGLATPLTTAISLLMAAVRSALLPDRPSRSMSLGLFLSEISSTLTQATASTFPKACDAWYLQTFIMSATTTTSWTPTPTTANPAHGRMLSASTTARDVRSTSALSSTSNHSSFRTINNE